jgi:Type IV pili methyl-accepting chemotaxis transducer N-term
LRGVIHFYCESFPVFSSIAQPLLSRRVIIQAAVAGLCLPTAHSANAEIALATAINRTARFRALAQRGTKVYAQLVLDVTPEASRKTLDTVQRLVQSGFSDLSAGSYNSEITQQIAATRTEASKLIALISAAPKLDQLAAISVQADKMTTQANKTTELLTLASKSGNAKIVDVAGRQRMLSQRMAKNYFLTAAGVAPASAREQIAADKADFKAAIALLQKSPISTVGIRGDLELVAAQWTFFEMALDKPRDPQAYKDMATTSERLLELTNGLTDQYEKALKDVLGQA